VQVFLVCRLLKQDCQATVKSAENVIGAGNHFPPFHLPPFEQRKVKTILVLNEFFYFVFGGKEMKRYTGYRPTTCFQ
jgi:hypothetical protein